MRCASLTLFPEDSHQLGDPLSHGASRAWQGQDSAIFWGARVEPGCLEPLPLGRAGGLRLKGHPSPTSHLRGLRIPWDTGPLAGAMDVTVKKSCLFRALEVQGKWGLDSTAYPCSEKHQSCPIANRGD